MVLAAPAACLPDEWGWHCALISCWRPRVSGGGFPLGAVLATEKAASGMTAGTHGSTYGGNPLGCAVGCTVLEHVAAPEFLAEVNRKASLFNQKLAGLVAGYPDVFEDLRGVGLMLGLKCGLPMLMWSKQAMICR